MMSFFLALFLVVQFINLLFFLPVQCQKFPCQPGVVYGGRNGRWGELKTLVGNCTSSGFQGGSQPHLARFSTLRDVAVDSQGNLFILESSKPCIFRMDAISGVVEKYAGEDGIEGFKDTNNRTRAKFNSPRGLAFNLDGDLLVADTLNHRVRIIYVQQNSVRTYAGSGSKLFLDHEDPSLAGIPSPLALAVVPDGRIFLIEYQITVIRVIFPNRSVSTFAGVPANSVYIDSADPRKVRFSAAMMGMALMWQPELSSPGLSSALTTSKFLLFVSDNDQRTIRVMDEHGAVKTVAGNGMRESRDRLNPLHAAFYFPRDLLVDTKNNVFVSEMQKIRRFLFGALPGGVQSVVGNELAGFNNSNNITEDPGALNLPRGMVLDGRGNLIFAENWNRCVRILYQATVSPPIYSPLNPCNSKPRVADASVCPSSNVYTQSTNSSDISPRAMSVATLLGNASDSTTYRDSVDPLQVRLRTARDTVIDPEGNLLVLERSVIRLVYPNGTMESIAGRQRTAGHKNSPDDGSRVWIGNTLQAVMNPNNKSQFFFTDNGYLRILLSIRTGGVVDAYRDRIDALHESIHILVTKIYWETSVQSPPEGPFGPAGTLIISVEARHRIEKVIFVNFVFQNITTLVGSPLSEADDVDGTKLLEARFNRPMGIAENSQGSFILADSENSKIKRIFPNGTVATIAGNGASQQVDALDPLQASFGSPTSITVDKDDNIFVVDRTKIRVIYSAGGVTTFAGDRLSGYVNAVHPLLAKFKMPSNPTLDSQGNMLLADAAEIRIIYRTGHFPRGCQGIRTSTPSIAHRENEEFSNTRTEGEKASQTDTIDGDSEQTKTEAAFITMTQTGTLLKVKKEGTRTSSTTIQEEEEEKRILTRTKTEQDTEASSFTTSVISFLFFPTNGTNSIENLTSVVPTELATNNVSAEPQDEDPIAAKITKAEVAVVATAATSVVVVDSFSASAFESGVAGNEMQSVVVLGLMQCSRPGMRKLMSDSKRAVIPLTVGDSSLDGIFGCLLLAGAALTLHSLAILIWTALRKSSVEDACTTLRFPSLSLTVMMLLYQGMTFESCKVLFSATNDRGNAVTIMEKIVAGVVLALSITIPILGALWVKIKCQVHYAPYQYVFVKYPSFVKYFIVPHGYWENGSKKRQFGFVFSSFPGREKWWMFLVPFAQALSISLIAGAFGNQFCKTQSAILTFVFLLTAITILLLRPYRVSYSNTLKCGVNFVSGLIAAAGFFAPLEQALSSLLLLISALSVVYTIGRIVVSIFERRWVKRERSEVANKSAPVGGARDNGNGNADAEELGVDDQEMGSLVVPMLKEREPLSASNMKVNPLDQRERV